jgi:DNA-binding response OmpR family regulator
MKLRVLVIDDDAAICNLLQTALSGQGYEVSTLADPSEFPFINKEACTCPADRPCADIIIADIVMPKVDGVDFFKHLKDTGCFTLNRGNVAIMSGYLTIHYMNVLNNLGIHYFRKPFEMQEIYTWVDECRERIEAQGSTTTAQ